MKRALFLCPSPYQIGTYHRAHAFARRMAATGRYEVDLLCTGDADRESEEGGVRVVQLRAPLQRLVRLRGFDPIEAVRRFAFARGHGAYDLVYSFEYQPTAWWVGASIARLSGAVHFNDWCDWYAGRHHKMRGIRALQRLDAFLEEAPRKRAECVTAICTSLRDRAVASGVPSDRVMLVREGAEVNGPVIPRREARRALGVSDDEFLVLSMADHGHEILVDGIRRLAGTRRDARLTIVGRVRDVEPDGRIRLPGRVSDEDLHRWLCAADLAWLAIPDIPLNHGRLPHKIGHFRMYGLPLVTNPVADAAHLGDPGIRYVGYSGESFARDAATRPALTDEARRAEMAGASLVFSWDRILEPLLGRIDASLSG